MRSKSCKDLFILAELPVVWLFVWSDNIFNIEVNGGFAIHILIYNSLTQIGIGWNFGFKLTWTSYWCHRKMILQITDCTLKCRFICSCHYSSWCFSWSSCFCFFASTFAISQYGLTIAQILMCLLFHRKNVHHFKFMFPRS